MKINKTVEEVGKDSISMSKDSISMSKDSISMSKDSISMSKDNSNKELLDEVINLLKSGYTYINPKMNTEDYRKNFSFDGIRGDQEIRGLTLKDIKNAIIQGFLSTSMDETLNHKVLPLYESEKNCYTSDFTENDLSKINKSEIIPRAVISNTLCYIEHCMGIFPNIPKHFF